MALGIGAQSYGQWSGCHAVAWERYANDYGDVDGQHSAGYRHSYPFGLMVNANGERFVDEGADFRNYTYAKYGRVVLAQPGGYAWQVFDSQVLYLLRDEYKMRGATKVRADTLEELVERMQDVNPAGFLKTVRDYNAAVKRDVTFDPNIKDGKRRSGSQSTNRTGRTRSKSRRLRLIRSAVALRSPLAASRSIRTAMSSTSRMRRSPDFMRRANSSAACSISIIRAVPG